MKFQLMDSQSFILIPFDEKTSLTLPISISGSIALHDNQIHVRYRINGRTDNIQFPDVSQQASRKNELWNATCCELFVGISGEPHYWEYNLSPSHDWAVFSFTDYRQNKSDELSISQLEITTKIDKNNEFELKTILALPKMLIGHTLDIGVSSVVQDKSGKIHYYALTHPDKQADFHDRNGFNIKLNNE